MLAHARALLTTATPEGVTAYIDADVHDPALIVSDARTLLNFDQPIAVMFLGILGHVADVDQACSIVARVMDAVPSGSHLALYDITDTTGRIQDASETYNEESGAVPYHLRSPDQILRCFDGLKLVEPGLVTLTEWRPDPTTVGNAAPVNGYGGLARKP